MINHTPTLPVICMSIASTSLSVSFERPPVEFPTEGSDSAWDEFQKLISEPVYEKQIPKILPMRITLSALIKYSELHGRICPNPSEWSALYFLVEEFADGNTGKPPPPPVSALSWSTISSQTKRMCFQAHIEWFHKHDLLESAADFLVNLNESQWLHV